MSEPAFLPGAREDYRDAYAWYHERGEHLAESFESAIDQALMRIAEAPERFGRYDARHRCFLLRRFPYSIVYRVEEADRVIVVAVAHHRRQPGYWQDRDD